MADPADGLHSPRLRLEIASDAMSATIHVSEGPLQAISSPISLLQAHGVVFGQIEANLAAVMSWVATSTQANHFEVAQGDNPQPAHDDYVEPVVKVGLRAGSLRMDGTMDFAERGLLTPVVPGEVVGQWFRKSNGRAGCDVRGQVVPAPTKRSRLTPLGPGIGRDDHDRLVALIAGNLIDRPGERFDVEQLHLHLGDVALRSGNLHTPAHLRVVGNVDRGFVADAGGDLEIRGGILGGTAIAGGNLVVTGGVIGAETGHLAVGGDAAVGHLQGAYVIVRHGLHVRNDSVNSNVHAQSMRVDKRLIGGVSQVESTIEVNELGSARDPGTAVVLAIVVEDPVEHARAELVLRGLDRRKHVRLHHQGRGRQARDDLQSVDQRIAQRLDVRRRALALAAHARVVVRGTLHPGVSITIGGVNLIVEKTHRHVEVRLNEGFITVENLS